MLSTRFSDGHILGEGEKEVGIKEIELVLQKADSKIFLYVYEQP
jgi:hypothetical protein